MNRVSYERNGMEGEVKAFCERNGLRLSGSFTDEAGEYSSLRAVKTLVKRGLCSSVVMYDLNSLGGDKYVQLENELFFKRNGTRLIFVRKPASDPRRAIVLAAKRMFSFVTDWDEEYGLALPVHSNTDPSPGMLPFGYGIREGVPTIDGPEAEIVRDIFEAYADGRPIFEIAAFARSGSGTDFSNMTVKTVLKNERYLGRISRKGVKLPPIIRYDLWLRAHERLERDYGPARTLRPFIDEVSSRSMLSFVRSGAGERLSEGLTVDSDTLEKELIPLIKEAASEKNADGILAFSEAEKLAAEEEYPAAAREKNRVILEFAVALDRVKNGDFSQEAQKELDRLTDLKNVLGMKTRRILSEKELFSIGRDEICSFLERARRLDRLSFEEQRLIANAFVKTVRIRENGSYALIASPSVREYKRIPLEKTVIE